MLSFVSWNLGHEVHGDGAICATVHAFYIAVLLCLSPSVLAGETARVRTDTTGGREANRAKSFVKLLLDFLGVLYFFYLNVGHSRCSIATN
jgi:hypothetical protein